MRGYLLDANRDSRTVGPENLADDALAQRPARADYHPLADSAREVFRTAQAALESGTGHLEHVAPINHVGRVECRGQLSAQLTESIDADGISAYCGGQNYQRSASPLHVIENTADVGRHGTGELHNLGGMGAFRGARGRSGVSHRNLPVRVAPAALGAVPAE